MTKKQERAIRKIALGTISEIDRRGWTKGTLVEDRKKVGERQVPSPWHEEGFRMDPIWEEIGEQDGRVCLVGAASSAFNPFYPENPGMNYTAHPDYEAFLRAVVAELPKKVQATVVRGDAGVWSHPSGAHDVTNAVALWNDMDSRTLKQVKTVLQRVADKYAPAPKIAA